MPRSLFSVPLTARLARAAGLALAVTVAAGTAAAAQSAVCRQIEAELAAVGQAGASAGGAYAREAGRARARLGQVQGRMASMGCDRGFTLFGPQPPAECGGLRAEANNLRATIAQYDGAARQASAGNPQRRAQLLAALDANNCRGSRPPAQVAAQPQPQRQRGFFEMLFGGGGQPDYATETMPIEPQPEIDKQKADEKAKKFAGGGPLAVCVRTCDGYFFPVNYQGAGGEFEEVCQASCPATEAKLFWMPAGGDLEAARADDGQRYTALPNAFQYRKAYDPSCSCKQPQQSWASALRDADKLVRDRANDITVTEERSNQMARPQQVRLRNVKGKTAPEEPVEMQLNTNFATNSTATAGIGPAVSGNRMLGTGDGETREVNSKDGERKQVRVLTPALSLSQ